MQDTGCGFVSKNDLVNQFRVIENCKERYRDDNYTSTSEV